MPYERAVREIAQKRKIPEFIQAVADPEIGRPVERLDGLVSQVTVANRFPNAFAPSREGESPGEP